MFARVRLELVSLPFPSHLSSKAHLHVSSSGQALSHYANSRAERCSRVKAIARIRYTVQISSGIIRGISKRPRDTSIFRQATPFAPGAPISTSFQFDIIPGNSPGETILRGSRGRRTSYSPPPPPPDRIQPP